VQSASPAECQLVEEVLAGSFLDELPARYHDGLAWSDDSRAPNQMSGLLA